MCIPLNPRIFQQPQKTNQHLRTCSLIVNVDISILSRIGKRIKKEKEVCGHWSRLFPTETSLLWPQRLPAARNPPNTTLSGATALTWWLSHLSLVCCSSTAPHSIPSPQAGCCLASRKFCLVGVVRLCSRLSRPVSSCVVYFLGIVAAGTLGRSWTLGPGRASTPQAPGERPFSFFFFSEPPVQCSETSEHKVRDKFSDTRK